MIDAIDAKSYRLQDLLCRFDGMIMIPNLAQKSQKKTD